MKVEPALADTDNACKLALVVISGARIRPPLRTIILGLSQDPACKPFEVSHGRSRAGLYECYYTGIGEEWEGLCDIYLWARSDI